MQDVGLTFPNDWSSNPASFEAGPLYVHVRSELKFDKIKPCLTLDAKSELVTFLDLNKN